MIFIKSKKILISLGGTYEAIDPVRGITNKSSGKMGLELAKQAYIRGADLTLVVGNVSVKIPSIFNTIFAKSTKEMNKIICDLVPDFDIFISAAAVSDFRPISFENHKLSSKNSILLEFKPNIKIISQIKDINPDIFLVGFKAEFNVSYQKIVDLAYKQIHDSRADLVIANDLGYEKCGFGSDHTKVLIVGDEIINVPLSSKKDIARIILDEIEKKV